MVNKSESLLNVVRLNKPKVLMCFHKKHEGLGQKGKGPGIGVVESPIVDAGSSAERRNLTHSNKVQS